MSALNSACPVTPGWSVTSLARLPAAAAAPRPHLAAVAVREPHRDTAGVSLEGAWREAPAGADWLDPHRIVARRWKDDRDVLREHSSAADPRFAVIAIALRPTAARLVVDGEAICDGSISAGFAVLTRPGLAAKVQFRSPCDVLHLFIPQQRLADIARHLEVPTAARAARQNCFTGTDPLIERLSWLLLKGGGDDEGGSSTLYLDGIALAIVSRLLGRSQNQETGTRGLVKWRLKRVQQFVEEQISEPLSLRDLARSAGLSRMHFAAQFRAATGMRPHEYLVRRRIQRAQEILLTTSMPLVEVALSVGFQTQAHFTTVFRRFLGETPGRWREAQRMS